MSEIQHFTQKGLETLFPKEKPYLVRDSELKGLGIKVYPTGNKTFFLDVLMVRKHDRFKVGFWPDLNVAMVREKARKMRTDLAQGKNPKAEKKEGITVGEFFLVYMERHGSLKKSSGNDRHSFEKYLKQWGNQILSGITRSKVEALHKTIGKEMPVQATGSWPFSPPCSRRRSSGATIRGRIPAGGSRDSGRSAGTAFFPGKNCPGSSRLWT